MTDADDSFGLLRERLHGVPSLAGWSGVVAICDRLLERHGSHPEQLGGYLRHHASHWPAHMRVAPLHWVGRPKLGPLMACAGRLDACRLDDADLIELLGRPSLPMLEHLTLTGSQLAVAAAAFSAHEPPALRGLRVLDYGGWSRETALNVLLRGAWAKRLRRLEIEALGGLINEIFNLLDEQGIDALEQLSLAGLDWMSWTDETASPPCRALKTLSLAHCNLDGGSSLSTIVAMLDCRELEALELRAVRGVSSGLPEVDHRTTLRKLVLRQCGLSWPDLDIFRPEAFGGLAELVLDGNILGDVPFEHLEHSPSRRLVSGAALPGLSHISLRRCGLGVLTAASLLGCFIEERHCLWGCCGFDALHVEARASASFGQLETIDLRDNPEMGTWAREALEASFPQGTLRLGEPG